MKAALVPRERVADYWPHVQEFIAAALEHGLGEMTEADVLHACMDGRMQLWIAVEPGRVVAAATTLIEDYPRQRHMRVMASGADDMARAIPAMWPEIEMLARLHGCQWVQFGGRPGWERAACLPQGTRKVMTVMAIPVRAHDA